MAQCCSERHRQNYVFTSCISGWLASILSAWYTVHVAWVIEQKQSHLHILLLIISSPFAVGNCMETSSTNLFNLYNTGMARDRWPSSQQNDQNTSSWLDQSDHTKFKHSRQPPLSTCKLKSLSRAASTRHSQASSKLKASVWRVRKRHHND